MAGESVKEGGSFAATSQDRGVFDQPSSSTTTNTTDDSNAVRLDPARSRAERVDPVSLAEEQELLGGPGVDLGARSDNVSGGLRESEPKGRDLREGGDITGDEPNASWSTDIGGKGDPGRVALKKIEAEDAGSREANGGRQYQLDSDNPYDELGGSTSS